MIPICSGLQTVARGLANKGHFRLTFRANKRRLGLILTANEPTLRLFVTFGDSGSLQYNCDERVEGDTLENPYQSMEKQGFLL
jgi:hypothetical protein